MKRSSFTPSMISIRRSPGYKTPTPKKKALRKKIESKTQDIRNFWKRRDELISDKKKYQRVQRYLETKAKKYQMRMIAVYQYSVRMNVQHCQQIVRMIVAVQRTNKQTAHLTGIGCVWYMDVLLRRLISVGSSESG